MRVAAALPVLFSLLVPAAAGGVELLEGTALRLRQKGTVLTLQSRDRALSLGDGAGSADDPTVHGGRLEITSVPGGFPPLVVELAAGGWTRIPKKASKPLKGWRHRGAAAVLVKAGGRKPLLSLRASVPGLDLGAGVPLPVAVLVRLGDAHGHCLEFTEATKASAKSVRSVGAARPERCALGTTTSTSSTTSTSRTTLPVGVTTTTLELPESDCLNGIDDDADGVADCADPGCVAVECVADGGAGWSAPGLLLSGAPSSLGVCVPPYDTALAVGMADLEAPAAECSACQCTTPVFDECLIGNLNLYTSASCPAGVPSAFPSWDEDTCVAAPVGTFASYRAGNGLAASGSCTLAADTTATVGDAGFAVTGVACQPPSGLDAAGCDAGARCVPRRPAALSAAPRCVSQAGEQACPAGYGRRHLYYGGFDDERGCAACGCSFQANGCTASISVYASANCSGSPLFSGATGSSCRAGDPGSFMVSNVQPVSPSCSTFGGAPAGCALPVEPTTVCCAPATGERACPAGRGPLMVEVAKDDGYFCIDATEVTNAQYAAFLAAAPSLPVPAACASNADFTPTNDWPNADDPDLPVHYVDWCDADAFCRWSGKRLCAGFEGAALAAGGDVADPTKSERHFACSAGGTQDYPYGPTAVSDCGLDYNAALFLGVGACCRGPLPGLRGLDDFAHEWLGACTGDSGSSDPCAYAGAGGCGSWNTLQRGTATFGLGFRCCAL